MKKWIHVTSIEQLKQILSDDKYAYERSLIESPSVLDRLAGLGLLEMRGYLFEENVIREVICNGDGDKIKPPYDEEPICNE